MRKERGLLSVHYPSRITFNFFPVLLVSFTGTVHLVPPERLPFTFYALLIHCLSSGSAAEDIRVYHDIDASWLS